MSALRAGGCEYGSAAPVVPGPYLRRDELVAERWRWAFASSTSMYFFLMAMPRERRSVSIRASIKAPNQLDGGLKACADRSWSARRSGLPTVAAPAFSDQSPHDDDHLREGHPEIDYPPPTLRTSHQLPAGVVPRTPLPVDGMARPSEELRNVDRYPDPEAKNRVYEVFKKLVA